MGTVMPAQLLTVMLWLVSDKFYCSVKILLQCLYIVIICHVPSSFMHETVIAIWRLAIPTAKVK